MQIAPVFFGLMVVVGIAQGASVGTLQDVSFSLNRQEIHVPSALLKRQTGQQTSSVVDPNNGRVNSISYLTNIRETDFEFVICSPQP